MSKKGEDPFESESLALGAKNRLSRACERTQAKLVQTVTAADQTTKALLELHDGKMIETVMIPNPERTTLCVSSQVGCARACDFCLTATMGLSATYLAMKLLRKLSPAYVSRRVEDFQRYVT